jgi:membrane-bound metal-dependent hydrolase YbcI (DUF457 family)
MFVGHYGVSFAVQRLERQVPLWLLFIAVQFLDVVWAPLILLGVEQVRIVPGITATNPLDLYYMPFSHSLVAAVVWSGVAAVAYRLWRGSRAIATLLVAAAVLSHWLLDFLVHRPDLPLYDNTAKVGLGLWNLPAVAFGLEAVLLFGGMTLFFRGRPGPTKGMVIFGVVMLGFQALVFFGPPPPSGDAAAASALLGYGIFAAYIARWEARHPD